MKYTISVYNRADKLNQFHVAHEALSKTMVLLKAMKYKIVGVKYQ